MSTYTLKSEGRAITFLSIGRAGYVYCDMGRSCNHGTLGRQICKGGGFAGSTLTASDDDLARVVRGWLKSYYRNTPAGERW